MKNGIMLIAITLSFLTTDNSFALSPEQQKSVRGKLEYLTYWDIQMTNMEGANGEDKVASNMISQAKRACRADINSSDCFNKTETAMKKARPLIEKLAAQGPTGGAAAQMAAAEKKETTDVTKPGLMDRMKAGLNKAKVSVLNTFKGRSKNQ